jgi:FixJ family two-component response regulator
MPEPLVAIIDDDPSVRRALTRLLGTTELRTQSFSSAAEFIKFGLPAKPDCLILDIHLGGMSGFELIERLRASGQLVPTILITAHDDSQTREQAKRSGAAYLRKPLDVPLLMQEISYALKRETPL